MSLEEFVRPIDPLARLPSCFGQSIALASFDECDCREIESASSEFQRVSECNLTSKSDHKPVLLDQPRRHHFGLALIALFKLLKGFLLLAAAIGLLNLMHSDVSATVEHWITVLRMDPDNQYFRWLLEKVGGISPEQIRAVSVGSFFYAGFLLTEGIGLWFERRWAEYLTVIATSSFIPLELYQLTRKVNDTKLLLLTINLAIVWYLIRVLRRQRKQ